MLLANVLLLQSEHRKKTTKLKDRVGFQGAFKIHVITHNNYLTKKCCLAENTRTHKLLPSKCFADSIMIRTMVDDDIVPC